MWDKLFYSSLLLWVALGLPTTAHGQTSTPAGFAPLLERLNQGQLDHHGNRLPDMPLPVLHRDSTYIASGAKGLNFELRLADKTLGLTHRTVQLRSHGYPVSYSVVFQNCLVALFKNGKFGCYRLADLKPDAQLERQLNVGSWKRHWLLEGTLVAQKGKGYFTYDLVAQAWRPYKATVPFGKQPKLYEDARYLVYADCRGEFGGNVYFYNKQTKQTHRANATCANNVWQEAGQYRLLVSLGHMAGSAACATIANPEGLPQLTAKPAAGGNWQYKFLPPEPGVSPVFTFYRLQLFGAFRYQRQTLYLMNWRATTFLVTIDGSRITIVDPLFANSLYTHNPVTTTYTPDLAVTNFDFYGLGGSDEVATLLWQGQQLTKIEWGKQPAEIK